MKRMYFITGALGHLGSTIVRTLLNQNEMVRGFDLKHVTHNNLDEQIEMFYGDIRKKEDVASFLETKENYEKIVIHCAGIVSISSHYDETVYTVNVNGTKNIVDLCLEKKIDRFIHVSSVHAIPEGKKGELIKEISYFNPNSVHGLYAKTKSEASQYVLDACKKGLNASIIHPSGIIGPNDLGNGHLTSMIIDYLNHNLTAIVQGGYDFVDVRDVSAGILSCVSKGKKGECYLITNHYFKVKDIMDMVASITHRKKIKTVLPLWFAKLTAPLSEVYYKIRKKPPLYTSYSLYTLQSNSLFSHKKATDKLDYQPRDMRETLKDTIKFLEEHGIISMEK